MDIVVNLLIIVGIGFIGLTLSDYVIGLIKDSYREDK